MATSGSFPLRIFCLHGYRQSEKTFRQKTGSLRKILKNKAELVYITAPNLVPNKEDNDVGESTQVEDQYGWWFSSPDDTYHAQNHTDCCKGYEQSIEKIAQFMNDNGPFDGILAFSQGASLLSLICALKETGDVRFSFKFAILVAGFRSRQSQHEKLYETVITTPSLHVIGDTDQVIQREMSDELLCKFKDPVVLRHPGGHFIPTSSQQKQVYLQFLNNFRDVC
ncbi:esterase OVCA2-like [Styela clava]